MTERRNEERHNADQVFAAITILGSEANDQLFGIVEDVSNAGIRMKTHVRIEPRSTLVLHASVAEVLFTIRGIVRRCDEQCDGSHEIGLEFSKLDRAERDQFLYAFHSHRTRVATKS